MTRPYVREVGRLQDMDGIPIVLGVDYDTVTISAADLPVRLSQGGVEEFSQIFVSACWEAAQQKGRMDEEAAVKGAFDMAPAMSSELPPRTCTCGQVPHDERCPALDDR